MMRGRVMSRSVRGSGGGNRTHRALPRSQRRRRRRRSLKSEVAVAAFCVVDNLKRKRNQIEISFEIPKKCSVSYK
jgi:hypothetical protein